MAALQRRIADAFDIFGQGVEFGTVRRSETGHGRQRGRRRGRAGRVAARRRGAGGHAAGDGVLTVRVRHVHSDHLQINAIKISTMVRITHNL